MNAERSIFSLPAELLVAIAAAGQGDANVPDHDDPALKLEWALSHTSSRFREVVTSTPALWTLVEAKLDLEGTLEIAKLYLERSRSFKISVKLKCLWSLNAEQNVLGQFVPHTDRICRLEIVLKTVRTKWAGVLLAPWRDIAAPNLQHLEVINDIADLYMSTRPLKLQLFLLGAPRLSFVKMAGFVPLPMPPWTADLKQLELWCVGAVGGLFIEIETHCFSLSHLYLDMRLLSAMPHRLHIPSLRSLRVTIPHDADADFLPAILDFFSTPALTELIIHNGHGTQILPLFNSISLPRASFPVLASLSFIKNYRCQCELGMVLSDTIFALPLALFPALSSLTLINQCFTADLLEGLFERPQSWPLLQTVTLCPMDSKLQAVSDALRFTVDQRRGQALPKFRLDPVLAALENWQEIGADVEVFDPVDILGAFHSP